MTYLIPAPYTGMSSFTAHLEYRTPPSQEPGTDYYMDRGTPLRAPADCRVVAIGGGIIPATGRFITLDDGTRWLRFLHLLEWRATVGQTLKQGEIFGLSGSSGYGSEFFGARGMADFPWGNTGGPHVHVTAFRGRRYEFNTGGRRDFPGTVDFHALTGGVVAGQASTTDPEEDDIMGQDAQNLQNSLDHWGREISNMIKDRRDVVVMWTPATAETPYRRAWVVDHGAGTKRDVAKGQADYNAARAYVDWLVAQGISELQGDQAPQMLAGYRDITP